MSNKRIIGAVALGVVIAGTAIGFAASTTKIKPGYAGIVYNLNGGIEDNVLGQGMHFVSPWKKVNTYSVATEQGYLSKDEKEGSKDDDSFIIPTSDGKTVNVDVEYSYHFDIDMLPETFTRFKGQSGNTIEYGFIRGKIKAWAQEVSSTFSVLDIYGDKRADLNKAVLEHVRKNFAEYGIVIDSINFSRIELDEATAAAIQDRINKQQEVESQKLENQKQQLINERNEAEAESANKIKIANAEAEAEANAKLKQEITDEILIKEFLEKWDGKLPTVTGEGNIMDISSLLGQ